VEKGRWIGKSIDVKAWKDGTGTTHIEGPDYRDNMFGDQ